MNSQIFTERNIPVIARKIVSGIKGGDVLAFSGNLATGKTSLTKEIARQMGYNGPVRSPTFVLEHHYSADFKDIREIIHLDFYRLNEHDIETFNYREYLNEPQSVIIIEWPELITKHLPVNTKKFILEIVDEKKRKITFPSNFDN